MAPVGMMAGLMLAAVVTYVMPKKYESYATIEIKPRQRQAIKVAPTPQSGGITAIVCGTEFEKIKSRNSLSKVIDSLDLMNRWGSDRETALQILKGIVQTENIRGTDLIQIRVRHTNKEDARNIAAEVARAYKDYRTELGSRSMERGVDALKKAVREQEDKVEEKRINMDTTRELLERNDSLSQPKSKQEALERSMDLTDYVDAKRDFETELSLLEQMKIKLISGEINQGLPNDTVIVHDDPVIADSPVSPNVTLNLVTGAGGGILISPLLALPLMWWMNRRSSRAIQAGGGF